MASDEKDMLTYDEAAAVLAVPKGTLYAMVSRRLIPHVRMGPRLVRFPRAELEEWARDRVVLPYGDDSSAGSQTHSNR